LVRVKGVREEGLKWCTVEVAIRIVVTVAHGKYWTIWCSKSRFAPELLRMR